MTTQKSIIVLGLSKHTLLRELHFIAWSVSECVLVWIESCKTQLVGEQQKR